MPPTAPSHISLTHASSHEAEWPVDAALFELPHDVPCDVTVSRTAAGTRPRYIFLNETKPADVVPDTETPESWDYIRAMQDDDTQSALPGVASGEGASPLEGGYAQVIVREREAKDEGSQGASNSVTIVNAAPSTITAVDTMSMSEGSVEHPPEQLVEPSEAGPHHCLSLELPLDKSVGELRLKSEGTLSLSSADLLEARFLSVVASKNIGVWPHLKVEELHVELKDGEVGCESLWTKRFGIVAGGASVQLITAFPDRGGRIETHLGTVNLELRGEPDIQRGTHGDCVVHVKTVHGNVILTTMPNTSILRRKHFEGTLSMGSKRAQTRWRRPTFESCDNIGSPGSVVNVLVGSR